MGETVEDILKRLAKSDTSSGEDSIIVQKVMRLLGFPRAVVVYGVVYPEGVGRPMSIHSAAKVLLAAAEKAKEKKDKKKLEDTGV